MIEQKKTLSFEASYTLDVICLLDLLFTGEWNEETELIHYWEDQIGELCEEQLSKIRKVLPKGETVASLLIPLIATDPEFNELRLTELLKSPKYLISQFKKQSVTKTVMKRYKKFSTKELDKVFECLSFVITALERAKFKSFWLEKRLPLINDKVKLLTKETTQLTVIEKINQLLAPYYIEKRCIYVISFKFPMQKVIELFNDDFVVSTQLTTSQVIECLTEQLVNPIEIHKQLKRISKALKGDKVLAQAFKQVKAEHKDLSSYLEESVKLSFLMFLNYELGIYEQPYQYLSRYQFGAYKISTLFYHYMETHHKSTSLQLPDYLIQVIEAVELDRFDQRFMSIMSQKL